LASRAEAVFKKLNTFLGSFETIKKGLENATDAYVKAEGQLGSGKGNLVKQVGEFKNLAPAIKPQLPAYFVDKAALEIDFIPAEQSIAALADSNEDKDLLAETDTESHYEVIDAHWQTLEKIGGRQHRQPAHRDRADQLAGVFGTRTSVHGSSTSTGKWSG
jgi:hypothetical protein